MCKDPSKSNLGSQRFTGSGKSRCKVRAGVLIIFIVYRETLVREKPDEEIQEKERKKEKKRVFCLL